MNIVSVGYIIDVHIKVMMHTFLLNYNFILFLGSFAGTAKKSSQRMTQLNYSVDTCSIFLV